MYQLSPRQVQALATLICGRSGDDDTPTEYRRLVDIEAFVHFTGVGITIDSRGVPRGNYAHSFVDITQSIEQEQGASGLGLGTEKIIEALLDLREFPSEDRRDEALLKVNQILTGLPVEARIASDGSVQVVSTSTTRSQQILDEQIHTVFGTVVADSALRASRVHYAKAHRHLTAADPDYENAAKEAVSSVESLVKALTGEDDYVRAIKKATDASLIPRPIDDIAIKLYAYRGNEPGVAHGSADTPGVTEDEAWLVFNLAGALGAYLGTRLRAK